MPGNSGRPATPSSSRRPDRRSKYLLERLLSGVGTHQLGLSQNMSLHRPEQLAFVGTGWQVEFGSEGIQFEEVAMGTPGRTGTAVAGPAPTVLTVDTARGRAGLFGQVTNIGRDIEQKPVIPGARRRVRIVHDQGQTLGTCG